MSGGAFNWLYTRDAGQLVENPGYVQTVADVLKATGYADDAAEDTQKILNSIEELRRIIETTLTDDVQKMTLVWRALEMWFSCDSTEDDFKKALETYRTRKAN